MYSLNARDHFNCWELQWLLSDAKTTSSYHPYVQHNAQLYDDIFIGRVSEVNCLYLIPGHLSQTSTWLRGRMIDVLVRRSGPSYNS